MIAKLGDRFHHEKSKEDNRANAEIFESADLDDLPTETLFTPGVGPVIKFPSPFRSGAGDRLRGVVGPMKPNEDLLSVTRPLKFVHAQHEKSNEENGANAEIFESADLDNFLNDNDNDNELNSVHYEPEFSTPLQRFRNIRKQKSKQNSIQVNVNIEN